MNDMRRFIDYKVVKKMNNITQIVKETIKKNQIITLFMVLLIGLTILISLIPPLVLEQIMNHLSIQKEVSWILIIGYFVFIACSKCFEAGQNSLITVFGQKIIHGVRSKMNEKINQLPANYFSQHESASITSILVNDVDTLDVLFSNGIISMFADAFKIMSILVVIFYKSKGLGIIMVIILPALFWMTRSFQKEC